jgi:ArsR family transcriptional regulator, arsenate/arsenite/antimonite-responsive transcriptional repressor
MFIYKRCKCESKIKNQRSINHLNSLSGVLKLVSVPSRLSILALLSDGPHCVCDIMTHNKMSQTLISHHLSDLTEGGLIESKKNGQFVDYNLTKKGKVLVTQLEKLTKI